MNSFPRSFVRIGLGSSLIVGTVRRTSLPNLFNCNPYNNSSFHFSKSDTFDRYSSSLSSVFSNQIQIFFKTLSGRRIAVNGSIGESIREIALNQSIIELECTCQGRLACSTCHIILPDNYYSLLPNPTEKENDALDMAIGLTNTSRLGCQIILSENLNGMEILLPNTPNN